MNNIIKRIARAVKDLTALFVYGTIYIDMNEIHEIECEEQAEGFPCICQQIQDRREAEMLALAEQAATGN